jgi:hypothetical protein
VVIKSFGGGRGENGIISMAGIKESYITEIDNWNWDHG